MSKGKWSDDAKKAWSEKCKLRYANKPKVETSPEEKERKRLVSIEINKAYWTPERRAEQSARMKLKVLENPNSYSKSNVSGRVKTYDTSDSNGPTKVKGQWELKLATWLNDNNIRWTNNIDPFLYFWNDNWHLYFPDFLLLDYDVLIEVKGYETDRDLAKWKSVTKKLIVLKKKEILSLDDRLMRSIVLGN